MRNDDYVSELSHVRKHACNIAQKYTYQHLNSRNKLYLSYLLVIL